MVQSTSASSVHQWTSVIITCVLMFRNIMHSFFCLVCELLKTYMWIINATIRKQAKHAWCPRLHLSSSHITSIVSYSPCFLLLCVCLPSPPLPAAPPPHQPGPSVGSERRLIQTVRPCLKCTELPVSWGTVNPPWHPEQTTVLRLTQILTQTLKPKAQLCP